MAGEVKKATPALKYMHLRSQLGNGVTSIGYSWDRATSKCFFQVARCCAKDKFNKKIAHAMCEGRMLKHGPLSEFSAFSEQGIAEFFDKHYHPDRLAAAHAAVKETLLA